MEPHSQADTPSDPRDILEGQLRELYGRVVYSHKTQEKCADILLCWLSVAKWLQIALLAISTGGFISVFFGKEVWGSIAGSAISAILLSLNLYMKEHDLGSLAQKHKEAANDTWIIREKYLSLITDLKINNSPLEAIQERRDILLGELHSVYSGSPSSWPRAYEKARKALKESEEMTFSDEEIDKFLPSELRRGSSERD